MKKIKTIVLAALLFSSVVMSAACQSTPTLTKEDIPDYSVVVGIPAKVVKTLDKDKFSE